MRYIIHITIGLLAFGGAAWAISIGPADEASGAPGDATCIVCHGDFGLNSGSGMLALEVPPTYGPADTIPVAVQLTQNGQTRWGFELTVLDSADEPVGQLLLTDSVHSQYSEAVNTRQYIKQTLDGTYEGTTDASPGWTLAWIAPTYDAGPVTFYATGNAANADGTSAGDYIYSEAQSIAPISGFPCCFGLTGNANDDADEIVDLTDLMLLVNHILVTFEPLPCPAEGNTNGDPNGYVTLTDITRLINYLYIAPFHETAPCQ